MRADEQLTLQATDRRKADSKHHLLTDAQGIPLAAIACSSRDRLELGPI